MQFLASLAVVSFDLLCRWQVVWLVWDVSTFNCLPTHHHCVWTPLEGAQDTRRGLGLSQCQAGWLVCRLAWLMVSGVKLCFTLMSGRPGWLRRATVHSELLAQWSSPVGDHPPC